MKKLLLLLIILITLSACAPEEDFGKESNEPKIIYAPDGASLELPAGALPDNVSTDDVVFIPTADGYSLEPKGTKLSYKAYLKYDEKYQTPIRIYLTDDDCEGDSCEATRINEGVTFELRDGESKVRVPIKEFGTIKAISGSQSMFSATAEASDAYVGEKVSAKAVIEIIKDTYTLETDDGDGAEYKLVDGTQTIQGSISGANVEPMFITGKPPKSKFGNKFTIESNDFTCKEEGPGSLKFEVFLTWRDEGTGVMGKLSDLIAGDNAGLIGFDLIAHFNCKKKEEVGGFKMIDPPSLQLDAGVSR